MVERARTYDRHDRGGAELSGAPVEHSPQAKAKRKRGEQEEFPSNPTIAKESSPANLTERSESIGSSPTNPTK